jgi:hypothetical protein
MTCSDDSMRLDVFAGTSVNAEELVVMSDFLAPANHFISVGHREDAAESLVEWAAGRPDVLAAALGLAKSRGSRRTVKTVLRHALALAEHRTIAALRVRAS